MPRSRAVALIRFIFSTSIPLSRLGCGAMPQPATAITARVIATAPVLRHVLPQILRMISYLLAVKTLKASEFRLATPDRKRTSLLHRPAVQNSPFRPQGY